MVAFSRSDLPDSVNSLEKLEIWVVTALQHLHPDTTAIETSGGSERVILSAPFFIPAATPPTWRNIARSSIPLSANWQRGGKIWNYALDLSGATLPAEFKS